MSPCLSCVCACSSSSLTSSGGFRPCSWALSHLCRRVIPAEQQTEAPIVPVQNPYLSVDFESKKQQQQMSMSTGTAGTIRYGTCAGTEPPVQVKLFQLLKLRLSKPLSPCLNSNIQSSLPLSHHK